MRSRSSTGSEGCATGGVLVCAGFHNRSWSTAGHDGRKGDGVGVRLLGYLLVKLGDFVGGRGAFHRSAIEWGTGCPRGAVSRCCCLLRSWALHCVWAEGQVACSSGKFVPARAVQVSC
jgi:hypothetical protein